MDESTGDGECDDPDSRSECHAMLQVVEHMSKVLKLPLHEQDIVASAMALLHHHVEVYHWRIPFIHVKNSSWKVRDDCPWGEVCVRCEDDVCSSVLRTIVPGTVLEQRTSVTAHQIENERAVSNYMMVGIKPSGWVVVGMRGAEQADILEVQPATRQRQQVWSWPQRGAATTLQYPLGEWSSLRRAGSSGSWHTQGTEDVG